MTFPINTNIPNAQNYPGNDQPGMRTNYANISGFLSVDHVAPGSLSAGYHQIIHLNTQLADPAMITGVQQIYSKNVTVNAVTDTQLFSMTGKGGISQLTGDSSGGNGFQRIGGSFIQWGSVTGLSGSWPTTPQTVTYSAPNISFVTNTWNVQITFIGPTSSSTADICINSVTKTGFTWQFTGSSSATFNGFFWLAVGK
jgi:hypothetical protein